MTHIAWKYFYSLFISSFVILLLSGWTQAAGEHKTGHEGDEHYCLGVGEKFDGHRHYTVAGRTCLYWKDVWKGPTSGFPDANLTAAENNCRDPDNRGTPWCYYSNVNNALQFGVCDVPKCLERDSVFMTQQECDVGRLRTNYKNGDIIPIYSDKWSDTTQAIKYPGCKLRFEACKTCQFHIKVDTVLPPCNSVSSNTCADNCQTLAVRDGLYNGTIVTMYSGTQTGVENFHTVSNVLLVEYCQLVNTFSQKPAKYKVTAFVTTKHVHETALSGELKSPNFPDGYYSEKETYLYSVDPPLQTHLDSNITLIFYDWDLNGSAGSTIKIRWFDRGPTNAQREVVFSSTAYRPAMFIPSASFQLIFETGSTNVNYQQQEIGFTAKFDHVNATSWPEKPDTHCGQYFPRSKSIGGTLTYNRISSPDVHKYVDCIWVIPIPRGYSHLNYKLTTFQADTTVRYRIRDGVTSQGPVITSRQYTVSGKGLFIHVSGYTQKTNLVMNMTYLATTKAYGGECRTGVDRILMFYCPLLDVCIDQELYASHAASVCGIDTKPKPLVCHDFKCTDGSRCYTIIEQCNMYKDCKDGSDENVTICYKQDEADAAPSVNLPLAISLPIVAILFLIPILIISVCIIRQRREELKDEELQASKSKLVTANGGHQGVDNAGLQLDDIPISVVNRGRPPPDFQPLDGQPPYNRAPVRTEVGAPLVRKANPKFDEIRADIHQGKSPYSPRGPGETQSMRVDPSLPPTSEHRPTRSHRFELPPDIDSIEELPDEPRGGRRYPPKADRHAPNNYHPPPTNYQKTPTKLSNYRPDEEYDRTPEGKSFRDQNPHDPNPALTRQPGDGSYLPGSPYMKDPLSGKLPVHLQEPANGTRPKTYEPRFSKNPTSHQPKNTLGQYRPEKDLPKRYDRPSRDPAPAAVTQSYRVEGEKFQVPPREARSYRFEPELADATSV